jgi:tetratricopeptide (TPR) repeat protein
VRRWLMGLAVVSCVWSANAGEPEDTRVVMRKVYAALATLLPAALAPEPMVEANRNGELSSAAESLADAAQQIQLHTRPADAGFGFLSRSLAQDAALIRKRLATDRFADAGVLVVRMTENCMACHSRVPAEGEPEFSAALTASVERKALSPVHRARLEIALRQFDRALEIHEQLLSDPSVLPSALDYTGALTDYLIVALRVKAAPERASAALRKFARRPDLSETLRRALPIWLDALSTLAPDLKGPPSLERAADILEMGAALNRYPADRADVVHKVIASSLLYRHVQGKDVPRDTLAEAFYLIGIGDAFLRRSFERSEAQFYLEQAIRLEPGSELAKVAFAELEAQTLLEYAGSSGLHLPRDVQRWLADLQATAYSTPLRGD